MRKILLYFALKYNGDYSSILKAIKEKEYVEEKELIGIEDKIKSKYLTILDDDYPNELKNIGTPPIILFYYGNIKLLNGNNKVAIIGTRKNTTYGSLMAIKIAKGLKKYKATIISGLAIGIDSIAQNVAIENDINTIAVLGSGIDNCYVKSNEKLYEKIKENGLIISEYPNNTNPLPQNFLIRNRIIAAISEYIIVVEAKYKSGTMNTVAYGLEFGKEIYCVPSLATNNSGCNMLIKQGAYLLESADDLFAIKKD